MVLVRGPVKTNSTILICLNGAVIVGARGPEIKGTNPKKLGKWRIFNLKNMG